MGDFDLLEPLEGEELSGSFTGGSWKFVVKKLPTFLTPVTMPLPTLPLGAIAASYGGATAVLGPSSQMSIDAPTARAALFGDLVLAE